MMYCCVNCFKDSHIIKTIENENIVGNCDFCSSKNIPVIDVSKENPISEMILGIVQSYSVSDDARAKPLKELLRDDWDIFNGGCEIIQVLLKALCSGEIDENDGIFSKRALFSQMYDKEFQRKHGLFCGQSWKQFANHIKNVNRFHNNNFNEKEFALVLTYIVKNFDVSDIFYRARICDNSSGFDSNKMFGPPPGSRSPGRINPEEMGVLYLSSDKDTILFETRAHVYDYITIGTFRPKKKLKIADLSAFSKISPFIYDESMIEHFAINRDIFHEMSQKIAKPLRRNDSQFEYLPTQFIAEFIKSQGYDGVAYESTINKGGYNYALFDESLVECINVETVEVTNIEYTTQER